MGNGEPDWEAYVGALESLTDISVLGITDYFSIEGYRYIRERIIQRRISRIGFSRSKAFR